jgi:hypothetical protein
LLEKVVEVRAIIGDDNEPGNLLRLGVVALRLRQSLAATGWALLVGDAWISGI